MTFFVFSLIGFDILRIIFDEVGIKFKNIMGIVIIC